MASKNPRLGDRRKVELGPPEGRKNRRGYIERRMPAGNEISFEELLDLVVASMTTSNTSSSAAQARARS
ncbi:MAG: hypothetical protein KGZ83_12820 [Sulfuricella sp.]|nr:hypothetical protein [Sulfuricella sp.]